MKRLFNLMSVMLLMVILAACGKQAGTEFTVDKTAEQYGQTDNVETTEREKQQSQLQEGDNTVTGDISFNFETKTVLLNSGYEMPIYGIGTYSLTGDTCVEAVTAALNSGVRLIDTAYMHHNDVICCEV